MTSDQPVRPESLAAPAIAERPVESSKSVTGAALTDDKIADLLFGEYELIKTEMQTYINLFHGQVNFLTLYLTIVAGLAAYAVSLAPEIKALPEYLWQAHQLPWPFAGHAVAPYQWIVLTAYLLVVGVAFVFLNAITGYIYVIEVLARRAAVIEREINLLAHRQLMQWETKVSPSLIRGIVRRGIWVSPSLMRVVWTLAVVLLIEIGQCISAPWLVGPVLGWAFIIFTVAAWGLQGAQLFLYRRTTIQLIDKIVGPI